MLRLCSLIAAAAALQLPGRRPQVSAPPGFTAPEPRPLAITDNAQIPGLLRGSAALAVRLATGVFVLGWRPSYVAAFGATLLGEAPKDGEYVLELGPFKFRDDSSVLPAARPRGSAAPEAPGSTLKSSPVHGSERGCPCRRLGRTPDSHLKAVGPRGLNASRARARSGGSL